MLWSTPVWGERCGMKLTSLCRELRRTVVQVGQRKSATLVSEFSFLIK